MKPEKKRSRPSGLRELTDRDLNQITRAVGEKARTQTLEQKARLKRELLEEIESVRKSTSHHGQ